MAARRQKVRNDATRVRIFEMTSESITGLSLEWVVEKRVSHLGIDRAAALYADRTNGCILSGLDGGENL